MQKLSKIFLTEGSPFLPEVTKSSLDRVAHIINSKQVNPITAIAYECLSIGEEALLDYLGIAQVINSYYTTKSSDIQIFFQGYSTPLFILSICCISNETNADKSIKKLPEPEIAINTRLSINTYILDVTHLFRSTLKKCNPDNHMTNVSKVFNHCSNDPYSKNNFFLTGNIAAQMVYREFFTRIDFSPKAFSYMGEIQNE
jgi:hypothetical protein